MWKNLVSAEQAHRTVVFSGGAGNIITGGGETVRNSGRDQFNTWLDTEGIPFFDPQIHPITHGRSYDWNVDGPSEKAARAAASVLVYQIGDDTIAAVTALEVMKDAMAGRPVVVWFSGLLSEKRKPTFTPKGVRLSPTARTMFGNHKASQPPAVAAHLNAYEKAGNQLRAELVALLADHSNVVFVTDLKEAKRVVASLVDKVATETRVSA